MTADQVRREVARRHAEYKVAERRVYEPGQPVRDEHVAQLRTLRRRARDAQRVLDGLLVAA